MTSERLYKVLNEDGGCYHGGAGLWSLPTRNDDGAWTPGEWMPEIVGQLEPCRNGYHLCNTEQLLDSWLGPAVFEAEYRGERIDAGDKCVVRQSRLRRRLNWDVRTARLFVCDCAERVLPLFEKCHPEDKRPRWAIETARRYARGEASAEEMAAARAAWAASDAARAAWAACDAAWAAWPVARAAERTWQIDRLTQYLEGEVSDDDATE